MPCVCVCVYWALKMKKRQSDKRPNCGSAVTLLILSFVLYLIAYLLFFFLESFFLCFSHFDFIYTYIYICVCVFVCTCLNTMIMVPLPVTFQLNARTGGRGGGNLRLCDEYGWMRYEKIIYMGVIFLFPPNLIFFLNSFYSFFFFREGMR
ncbi:hypothetical protein TbgDal_X15480 [Trypanosoma brucei gambiense DAL972]|uniref:Uncharacterized protein n=1 Tax=Trypanosoma brucei gambiense (strain MHOM/CI/86/DAL972) TaxID=679716 RepID=D0A5A5_TRYB9|nr:hypothetical protein TbgDal_X15480 [Trypanosoma brucei gambiense DAL972]CBH16449.1 hypothetical protein TbgDal_X15480 [Trypanosoma brucei gambiense DAL972]|eukprot:XP_011778713.1 hypothetical protein TbgDal_X15480 [Trypanosoma brucei gambiense DAL972]